MTIGALIKQYLDENDMSQRQFAKKCGMSNGYISMLINNVNPKTERPVIPSLSALLAISNGLGITLDVLFETVDDMQVDISAAKNLSTIASNKKVGEFVDLFVQLTDDQQRMLIMQMKGLLSK